MAEQGSPKRATPTDRDAVLMRRIRDRDENALAAFYDDRGGLVYSLALSIVRNVSDAEEVTQEVFLKLWQKADSFDESRGGRAWGCLPF